MFEVVIIACLAGFPAECREHTIPIHDETMAAVQCAMGIPGVQAYIAPWAAERPQWEIKRWRCRPAGQFAKI